MVQKQALDQTAKSYWEEYYGDYGRAWTKDIPLKIQAALKESGKKLASAAENLEIIPIEHAVTADRVILEGVARSAKHDKAELFRAAFTHDGEVVDFETIDAPAS